MNAKKNCRMGGRKCYNFELKQVDYNPAGANCYLTGSNQEKIEISINGLDQHSSSYVNHYYAVRLKTINTPFVEFSKDGQNWNLMNIEIKPTNTIDSRVPTSQTVYVKKNSNASNIIASVECTFSHSATSDLCKPCNHTATIFIDLR